jgi:hypothetical protein
MTSRRPRLNRVALASTTVFLVCACGGGGGGGGTTNPAAGGGLLIRGPITGLQGDGLVVQNNGASDQSIPAGGNVFFFQNVPSGSTYNVTVKTQPASPWQTCVVANGTGTIRADVTTASIACSTNSYAVRGTVSGLTGAGLTLLMNGAGAIAVAAGASSVAFPAIASGQHYEVTIGTQPVGQTCFVIGGSGSVTSADVTSLAVTCGATGFTVGGTIIAVAVDGLALTLNGTTNLSVPALATSFTFPAALQTGADFGIRITAQPSAPVNTCVLWHGRGRIAAANATAPTVQCYANATLAPYAGTYLLVQNGQRNYLPLWPDGSYSMAARSDDPTCTNNGNGTEYGAYQRSAAGTFSIRSGNVDTNGPCGIYTPSSSAPPGTGLQGTMTRNGNTLTIAASDGSNYVLTAVESNPASLVGSFVRADGQDGSFIVFQSDGTYLFQETQDAPAINVTAGYELGCYAVSGATFTVSFGASCKPGGLTALDLNGKGGFSAATAPIPFTINSATSVTIGGVLYNRLLPGG